MNSETVMLIANICFAVVWTLASAAMLWACHRRHVRWIEAMQTRAEEYERAVRMRREEQPTTPLALPEEAWQAIDRSLRGPGARPRNPNPTEPVYHRPEGV